MKVYDLDKTQEWMNRTMQIGKEPPLRGGLKPDKSRRQTLLALASVLTILGLGILLAEHFRPAFLASAETGKLKPAEGITRVLSTPPVVQSSIPLMPPVTPIPISPRFGFDAPEINLSGGIRPLPGHVAPPAPIWIGER